MYYYWSIYRNYHSCKPGATPTRMHLRLCFGAITSLSLLAPSFAKDPAWNGYVSSGSTTPSQFTPFYVPTGSKQIDSSNSAIHYSGSWNTVVSPKYINGSVLSTSDRSAYATLFFSGSGIELYGNRGKRHGQADVYLDGNLMQTFDGWASQDQQQQLLSFSYNLSSSRHSLKVVNRGSKSGSLLELDAFVVLSAQNSPAPVKTRKHTPDRKSVV